MGGNGDEEGDPEEYGFLPNSQGSPQQNGNGHYGHPAALTGTGSSQNRPILPEMNDRESRRILRVKRELERIQEVSIYFSNTICFDNNSWIAMKILLRCFSPKLMLHLDAITKNTAYTVTNSHFFYKKSSTIFCFIAIIVQKYVFFMNFFTLCISSGVFVIWIIKIEV